MPERPNIAIDGPAGAGKSTVARRLARLLGYIYIDTGAMYRALTWKALQEGLSLQDGEALTRLAERTEIDLKLLSSGRLQVYLDGKRIGNELRQPGVTSCVSRVAAVPGVRLRMVELQRKMAEPGGVVMDGRDIGSVVLPDARHKFFLTASLEERALRRVRELARQGYNVKQENLQQELACRDKEDSSRELSPLVRAEDAREIDTTYRSITAVVQEILKQMGR